MSERGGWVCEGVGLVAAVATVESSAQGAVTTTSPMSGSPPDPRAFQTHLIGCFPGSLHADEGPRCEPRIGEL